MTCVLLAERHYGLADRVRELLETTFGAVFIVADDPSLMEGAARLQPALVVLDVALAGGDLPCLLDTLRKHSPSAKVLLLSVHDEPTVAVAAFVAGADGLVLKRAIASDLLPAVDALLAGRRYVSPVARYGATAVPTSQRD